MDITFYALVTLACAVLVLAMWSCAASGVNQWGPDLTPELLPYIIQDALSHQQKQKEPCEDKRSEEREAVPTAPTDLPGAPLLSNAEPISGFKPPSVSQSKPVFKNTVVRVFPPGDVKQHKLRPTVHRFVAEDPV